MKYLNLFLLLLLFSALKGQERLTPLPEPITNNAVVALWDPDTYVWVYTFGGLDSTKAYDGIHKRAYRLNLFQRDETWEQLPDLPSGPGRIAAAASEVNGKIYIIGGYEVLQDGSEVSLDKVHIFDHQSGQYLPDGAPVPVPIDDQVQAVWRDSLIYVITGWSNTGNVPNVQIYNPTEDSWMQGTPVPNNSQYKAFGASGIIYNDTIWYAGGAAGSTFFAANYLRKGVINPANPSEIEWSVIADQRAVGYRSAVSGMMDCPVWVGGSTTTYNYDGIAYNGTGGVNPKTENYAYNPKTGFMEFEFWNDSLAFMDSRGFAFIPSNRGGSELMVQIGGMRENQVVSSDVLLMDIAYASLPGEAQQLKELEIFPNPSIGLVTIETPGKFVVEVLDLQGRILHTEQGRDRAEINLPPSPQTLLFLKITNEKGEIGTRSVFRE